MFNEELSKLGYYCTDTYVYLYYTRDDKELYYADYDYDFPYEVITDKNKLLLEIMNGKEINK